MSIYIAVKICSASETTFDALLKDTKWLAWKWLKLEPSNLLIFAHFLTLNTRRHTMTFFFISLAFFGFMSFYAPCVSDIHRRRLAITLHFASLICLLINISLQLYEVTDPHAIPFYIAIVYMTVIHIHSNHAEHHQKQKIRHTRTPNHRTPATTPVNQETHHEPYDRYVYLNGLFPLCVCLHPVECHFREANK